MVIDTDAEQDTGTRGLWPIVLYKQETRKEKKREIRKETISIWCLTPIYYLLVYDSFNKTESWGSRVTLVSIMFGPISTQLSMLPWVAVISCESMKLV